MGRQEFLSGGFRGKLGATVGQRYKSKLYVRSYVVPANPRTPDQQKNRGLFTTANQLAQAGMNFTGRFAGYDTENKTEYNQRVSQAMKALLQNTPSIDSCPLFPYYAMPPVSDEFVWESYVDSGEVDFYIRPRSGSQAAGLKICAMAVYVGIDNKIHWESFYDTAGSFDEENPWDSYFTWAPSMLPLTNMGTIYAFVHRGQDPTQSFRYLGKEEFPINQ